MRCCLQSLPGCASGGQRTAAYLTVDRGHHHGRHASTCCPTDPTGRSLKPMIRFATSADTQAMARIYVASWRIAYRGLVPQSVLDGLSVSEQELKWAQLLAPGQRQTLICENEGDAVGWVSMAPSRDGEAASETSEIVGLYVDPSGWRKGHGSALLHRALGQASGSGSTVATLWLPEGNQAARGFYARHGFRRDTGTRTVELGEANLVEVRYRVEL